MKYSTLLFHFMPAETQENNQCRQSAGHDRFRVVAARADRTGGRRQGWVERVTRAAVSVHIVQPLGNPDGNWTVCVEVKSETGYCSRNARPRVYTSERGMPRGRFASREVSCTGSRNVQQPLARPPSSTRTHAFTVRAVQLDGALRAKHQKSTARIIVHISPHPARSSLW